MFVEIRSGITPKDSSWGLVGSELRELETLCAEMGLSVTLAQIQRVHHMVASDEFGSNLPFFGQQLIEIQTRLNDELAGNMIFSIHANNVDYLDAYAPSSGKITKSNRVEEAWNPVFTAFPSTKYDAMESFKSYALERNTACVFHLMRVLEIGLGALGGVFGVSLAHTNWAPAIDQMESKIRDMHKDPTWKALPDCKEQQEFYAQAASHFGVLKDAWRNYTAHARGKYDSTEASDILTSVRAFMQKLATRLHE